MPVLKSTGKLLRGCKKNNLNKLCQITAAKEMAFCIKSPETILMVLRGPEIIDRYLVKFSKTPGYLSTSLET